MAKSLILHPKVVKKLAHLRKTSPKEFDAAVLSLYTQGWSLSSIGDPLGVTKVTVKNWKDRADRDPATRALLPFAQMPPLPLEQRDPSIRPRKIVRDIPSADRIRIRELQEKARRVRSWTLPESEEQRAADELEDLINLYVLQRKVSPAVFARHAGVTRRAIVQRIEKL